LSDTRTKVLQSPQLRGVDGAKSSMKIGEKEPTASGSFANTTGAISGTGISPLVNTQFTYLDVGVNVEITPHVHDNGDVSLHVSLDISSVTGQVNLGGINEPIIGQRKIEQDIRLHEGEVNLIGGLLSTQDNKTKTGVPGLANIPILGKLFSGDSVDRERDEIMIAMIPHVVRRPDITPENLRGVSSGPQQTVTLRRAPIAVDENLQPRPAPNPAPAPAAAAEAAAVPPAGQPVPVPVPTSPRPSSQAPLAAPIANPAAQPPVPAAAPPGTMPPATAPPETSEPAVTVPPATAPPAAVKPAANPSGPVKIHFTDDEINKSVGETFKVDVNVENAHDVISAPFTFQYDPKLLSLDGVAAGRFWSGDGEDPLVIKNVQNESGLASIRVNRKPGSAAVGGNGTLLTVTLKALAPGAARLTAANITLNNAQTQSLGSGSPVLTINIK
jgi:general secretion pathway protein D